MKADNELQLWLPLQDRQMLALLSKLIEENSECAKAASRCIMQGMEGVEPKTGQPNVHDLEDEIADVLALCTAVIDSFGLNTLRIGERAEKKIKRVKAWIAMIAAHESEQMETGA